MSKKNNAKVFGKARVFKAPLVVGRDGVTITFPKSVIDYLNVTDGEVFWSPVNGVIQISAAQPQIVIPLLSMNDDEFVPQKNARAVAEE